MRVSKLDRPKPKQQCRWVLHKTEMKQAIGVKSTLCRERVPQTYDTHRLIDWLMLSWHPLSGVNASTEVPESRIEDRSQGVMVVVVVVVSLM